MCSKTSMLWSELSSQERFRLSSQIMVKSTSINDFKIISANKVFVVKPHAHRLLIKVGFMREKIYIFLKLHVLSYLELICLIDIEVMSLPRLYIYSITCHQRF